MVLSERVVSRKRGWASLLVFAGLALAATVGGIFLPQGLREGEAAPVTAPAAQSLATAPETLEYSPPDLPELPSPQAIFLRLGIGTGVVLALCVLTLLIGKRWIQPLAAPATENKHLRVLEALPLGGRCSVYLLQVGETRILAGVDHTGLKTLLPLPQSFDGALAELDEAKGADSAARRVQYEAPEAA